MATLRLVLSLLYPACLLPRAFGQAPAQSSSVDALLDGILDSAPAPPAPTSSPRKEESRDVMKSLRQQIGPGEEQTAPSAPAASTTGAPAAEAKPPANPPVVKNLRGASESSTPKEEAAPFQDAPAAPSTQATKPMSSVGKTITDIADTITGQMEDLIPHVEQEEEEEEEASGSSEALGALDGIAAIKGGKGALPKEDLQRIESLKTDFTNIKKATKEIVGNFVNISRGKPIQDLIKKRQRQATLRRKQHLQRQLLGGNERVTGSLERHSEAGAKSSLLELRASEDAAAAQPDFSAARQRLLNKINAAKGKIGQSGASSPSTATSAPSPSTAETAATEAPKQDEAPVEEQPVAAEEEASEHEHLHSGHGEVLMKVLNKLQEGAHNLTQEAWKDARERIRIQAQAVEEGDGEVEQPVSKNFFLDPAAHVKVMTNKFKKLGDFIKGGVRSMAHDATKSLGTTNMEDFLTSAVHKHSGE